MVGQTRHEFLKAIAIAKEHKRDVTGLFGYDVNQGRTEDAMDLILNRMKSVCIYVLG